MTQTTAAQKLETILEEALRDLTILVGQNRRIGVDTFGVMLRRNRSTYAPDIRYAISSAQFEINNTETEAELLKAINEVLADYIKDGEIYTCVQRYVSGKQIEAIMRKLLVRAITDGPQNAAQALLNSTTDSSCVFYKYVLITGVQIPEKMDIVDGMTLIPLPNSIADFPYHIPSIPDAPDNMKEIGIRGLEAKTLVRTECETYPILKRPEGEYTLTSGPERHFTIKSKVENCQDHEIDILLQSLSLVGECKAKAVMAWESYLNYEVFDTGPSVSLDRIGYITLGPGQWSHTATQLSKSQMRSVKDTFVTLTQSPANLWESLNIPISRWAESLDAKSEIDKIIDLSIALESLYVTDGRSGPGVLLALHAAWHLGKSKSDRKNLRNEFQQFYRMRSDAIHAGKLRDRWSNPQFNTQNIISRFQKLGREGIISIIRAGKRPCWKDLVMGDD